MTTNDDYGAHRPILVDDLANVEVWALPARRKRYDHLLQARLVEVGYDPDAIKDPCTGKRPKPCTACVTLLGTQEQLADLELVDKFLHTEITAGAGWTTEDALDHLVTHGRLPEYGVPTQKEQTADPVEKLGPGDVDIRELGAWVENGLRERGINTLGELTAPTREELLDFLQLSRGSVEQIVTKLKLRELGLRPHRPEVEYDAGLLDSLGSRRMQKLRADHVLVALSAVTRRFDSSPRDLGPGTKLNRDGNEVQPIGADYLVVEVLELTRDRVVVESRRYRALWLRITATPSEDFGRFVVTDVTDVGRRWRPQHND